MKELPIFPDHIQPVVDTLDAQASATAAVDPTDGGAAEGLVWLQVPNVDKYSWEGQVSIECESRLHLCHAMCCRLRFPLSEQDLLEGVAAWDPEAPYMNLQDDHGWCAHMNGESLRCSIYAHRPLPCRAFDCRNDRRIWLDFDNRIPNPALAQGSQQQVVGPISPPRGQD